MADRFFPTGFDVGPNAPQSLEELRAHVNSTGRMLVYDWASDDTIFGDAGVNWAFRAWHDWTHLRVNGTFDIPGEIAVANQQIDDIRAVYGEGKQTREFEALIWAEVMGQVLYASNHNGAFPDDQRAFYRAYSHHPDTAVSPAARF
jgi:hypothetical protein